MLGTLGTLAGNTLQTGPGRVYRDGSLGCIGCGAVLQSGAGVAFKDGSLGGQLASGPGSAAVRCKLAPATPTAMAPSELLVGWCVAGA